MAKTNRKPDRIIELQKNMKYFSDLMLKYISIIKANDLYAYYLAVDLVRKGIKVYNTKCDMV